MSCTCPNSHGKSFTFRLFESLIELEQQHEGVLKGIKRKGVDEVGIHVACWQSHAKQRRILVKLPAAFTPTRLVPNLGLKKKSIFGVGGLLLLALGLTGGVAYWQALHLAEQHAMNEALDEVNHLADQFEATLSESRHSLMIVRDTPPVQAIIRTRDAGGIDPLTGDKLEFWEHRLKTIFASVMAQLPQIQQIRYLDEAGDELVRVNSAKTGLRSASARELQKKANRDYFTEGMKLDAGEVFISAITLNREFGEIQVPHTPVLRMATPYFDEGGVRRGVLVINILTKALFARLKDKRNEVMYYVTNEYGYYVHHPDVSKSFGFEFGLNYTLEDEYPLLAATIQNENEGVGHYADVGKVEAFKKLFIDVKDTNRYLSLIAVIPDSVVFAGVQDAIAPMLLSMLTIIILSLIFIIGLVNKSVITPVLNLATAAHEMAQGDLTVRVPEQNVGGEFRELYQVFNRLAEHQQQATIQLNLNNNYLNSIVSSVVDGLITIDRQGTVQRFNPAAVRIFGYLPDEVIGNNVKMLMPEPYQSGHDGYLSHFHKTGEKKVIGIGRVVEGQRKDGSIFPLDLAVSKIGDGTTGYIGIIRDITEAHQIQIEIQDRAKRLRAQQDTYALLSKYISSSRLDIQNAFQMITEDGTQTLGLARASIWLFGDQDNVLRCKWTHDVDNTSNMQNRILTRDDFPIYFQALECNDAINADDACLDPRTAEFKDVYLKPQGISAMLDVPILHAGKVEGVLCLEHKGDTRHWHPDEIVFARTLSSSVTLLLEINRRLQAEQLLQHNNIELDKANQMKSDFLANMSHELRTPLNAIIGFSEVMKDGLAGEMNNEQLEYTGDIYTSGQHLLSLINDILDLSKVEAGKMELRLEDASLNELVQSGISIVREQASNHDINLKLDMSSAPEVVHVDIRKVKQILFNLLSNAVKFSSPNSNVTITVKQSIKAEAEVASESENWLQISVADQGIGIGDSDIPRLFKSFQQLENPMTKSHQGTGLGLVLVKQLAKLHGGGISVRSTLGEGSCFTLWLPIKAATKTDKKNVVAGVSGLSRVHPDALLGPKILVIEDDSTAASLLLLQLEQEGYRCDWVSSAEKALNWLESELPDMITLDIMLPGMDGWQFLEHIKQNKRLNDIPVVIISMLDDEGRAFSLGASRMLNKPVKKKELLHGIASLGLNESGKNLTALVVDDDAKVLKLLERHLHAEGFIVLKAQGGQQGIDMAREYIPDLMLLDLMMPKVSGFDVVDAMKALPSTLNIPIIILTAKDITAEDRQQLNGDIIRIMQKREMNHVHFFNEFRRVAEQLVMKKSPLPEGKAYVLVADDNLQTARLLQAMLQTQGYEVACVGNGRNTLEMMASRIPDLVVLDMMMPELDGLGFLEEKEKIDTLRDVPVLVVSCNEEAEKKGKVLGAHVFLSKPFDRDNLLSTAWNMIRDKKHHPTVLVIDDDVKAIKLVSTHLEKEGFSILTARGGSEGLEIASRDKPDLILLDMMMPDMSGFEVIDHLGKDEATQNIPVVVLSSKRISERERVSLMQTVKGIFNKSEFKPHDFIAEARRLISKGGT